jgi:amino acid transporter
VITLCILIIASFISIIKDNGNILYYNYTQPFQNDIGYELYLGYSVSLLGLTGFETSANYIEEAGPFETEKNKVGPTRRISVFEKTIDAMWYLVALINPTIALMTLGVVPLPDIVSNAANILSIVADRSGGKWLRVIVGIDAILVLCGGVLTAYVGVVGLVHQLASDRCLPNFLLAKNETFGTHHWIIISFFLLCSALYLMTGGDVIILSGVFSIAFLMVLINFAFANMCLKLYRPRYYNNNNDNNNNNNHHYHHHYHHHQATKRSCL